MEATVILPRKGGWGGIPTAASMPPVTPSLGPNGLAHIAGTEPDSSKPNVLRSFAAITIVDQVGATK